MLKIPYNYSPLVTKVNIIFKTNFVIVKSSLAFSD
jgi:hypothetical protein